MTGLFHVEISTPKGAAYSGDAASLVVPAEYGYLGVLANHAPLIARLKNGNISLVAPEGHKNFRCSGKGFMEVINNNVAVIMDEVVPA